LVIPRIPDTVVIAVHAPTETPARAVLAKVPVAAGKTKSNKRQAANDPRALRNTGPIRNTG